jgi:putative transposase
MKKYMRFSQDEKAEIIDLTDKSELGVNRTLKELGIPKRTFYNWYARYLEQGYDGLAPKAKGRRQTWNKIPQHQQNQVVEEALLHTESSSRELATHIVDEHKWFISESSVYRILKERGLITAPAHIVLAAADEFKKKTVRVNQMWQTDFSYFKIINWGWYYLITVMDDYSRYIVYWELCKNMEAGDVRLAVDQAMLRAGLNKNNAPTLLSDNGPCFIAKDLEKYLKEVQGINPIHGRACHPQTQGKIERYHRTMKNVVKLDNFFFPEELVKAIETFVNHYNYHRYHESLNNLTPADVYFGRAQKILQERRKIKEETIAARRKNYIKEKLELQLAI